MQPEKRKYVLNMMDDTGDLLLSIINLDEYLQMKYPRKYEKSREEWYIGKAVSIYIHHLDTDTLTVPLILLLKIISGEIV